MNDTHAERIAAALEKIGNELSGLGCSVFVISVCFLLGTVYFLMTRGLK